MTEPARKIEHEDVVRVFKSLAAEHAFKRQPLDCDLAWDRIESGRARGVPQKPHGMSRWRVLLVAALSVLAVGVGSSAWLWPTTLQYVLSGAHVEGDAIVTGARPGLVEFSDGSRIDVEQRSVLRVSVVGERAALTRLNRGELRVKVQHREGTDWRFLAGPYEVRVVGTEFDIAWDPETEHLAIAMRRGKVIVVSPDQPERTLRAGDRWDIGGRAQADAGRVANPGAAPAPSDDRASSASGRGATGRAVGAPGGFSTPGNGTRDSAEASVLDAPPARWPEWVRVGRFGDVVRAAEARGIDRVLSELGPAELRSLAHAATYTGRDALAVRTWTTLRRRFSGRAAARDAAFFLGRLRDQEGRPGDAQRWLDLYLSEAPGGTYASEALGRKLTLVQRLQGTSAARAVASEYLERFPGGAHAATARSILAEE